MEESSNSQSGQSIKVCVRVRPVVNNADNQSPPDIAWAWGNNTITLDNPNNAKYQSKEVSYHFDNLFEPEHTNQDIFSSVVENVVSSSMKGYHGSVFSYGQTSSGKTFTMNGNAAQPGVIPQAIRQVFDEYKSFPSREFLLRVSYLEVYNEQIKDLLASPSTQKEIKIQHDPTVGTRINGAIEQVVKSPEEVFSLLQIGEKQRHVGATDMNDESSRAHTIFKMIIESKEVDEDDTAATISTLNLVDLAGSESAKMTNAKVHLIVPSLIIFFIFRPKHTHFTNFLSQTTSFMSFIRPKFTFLLIFFVSNHPSPIPQGDRAREGKHINQSLLTLSTIIQRLSEDCTKKNPLMSPCGTGSSRKQHLPYRDSKLTRLLESALDGNAQIAIICTISPTVKCADESLNTLKFAARAKVPFLFPIYPYIPLICPIYPYTPLYTIFTPIHYIQLIKIQPRLNEVIDDKTLLKAYRLEIKVRIVCIRPV